MPVIGGGLMPVTFGRPGSASDRTAPYSITMTTAPAAPGDIMFATALAGEWRSAAPGGRTLSDPTEPGWTRLHLEEFQVYPTVPTEATRRMVFGAWWKIASGTTETATITLTGGALIGRLVGGIVAASGVNTTLHTQASTRRENVDLGTGPTPWSPTIPPIGARQVGFLVYQAFGTTGYPTPSGDGHTGWTEGRRLITSGLTTQRILYVEGTAPPIVWPNQNINAMVSIVVFGMPGGGWQIGSVGWGPA